MVKANAVLAGVSAAASHATLASAQSLLPGTDGGPGPVSDLSLAGGGWNQIYDLAELQAFGLDVLLTLALAALITFHPIRLRSRRTPADFAMPRLFMFYALIGMAVGFLVLQHGYIIGFVVFGIGALLRFRSRLDDPVDTVEMILATVLGLCVGLNLPVMGVSIGIVSWLLIWATSRKTPVEVRLQADTADALDAAIAALRGVSSEQGWKEAHFQRARAKDSARFVLLVGVAQGIDGAEAELSRELPDDTGLSWKVSG